MTNGRQWILKIYIDLVFKLSEKYKHDVMLLCPRDVSEENINQVLALKKIFIIRTENYKVPYKIGFCNKQGNYEEQPLHDESVRSLLFRYSPGDLVRFKNDKEEVNKILRALESRTLQKSLVLDALVKNFSMFGIDSEEALDAVASQLPSELTLAQLNNLEFLMAICHDMHTTGIQPRFRDDLLDVINQNITGAMDDSFETKLAILARIKEAFQPYFYEDYFQKKELLIKSCQAGLTLKDNETIRCFGFSAEDIEALITLCTFAMKEVINERDTTLIAFLTQLQALRTISTSPNFSSLVKELVTLPPAALNLTELRALLGAIAQRESSQWKVFINYMRDMN